MDRKLLLLPIGIVLLLTGCELVMVGRLEEARAEAAEVMRIDPKFSLEDFTKRFPWKDQARLDRFFEACRKAGVK